MCLSLWGHFTYWFTTMHILCICASFPLISMMNWSNDIGSWVQVPPPPPGGHLSAVQPSSRGTRESYLSWEPSGYIWAQTIHTTPCALSCNWPVTQNAYLLTSLFPPNYVAILKPHDTSLLWQQKPPSIYNGISYKSISSFVTFMNKATKGYGAL
jgi:hypothetical protein